MRDWQISIYDEDEDEAIDEDSGYNNPNKPADIEFNTELHSDDLD